MSNHPAWKHTWKTFTKQEAKSILDSHLGLQRRLDEAWVDALTRKIDLGLWEDFDPSQSPVAFDKDRKLINGQHRLRAFLKSKKDTLTALIITGLDPEDYRLFDQETKARVKAMAHSERDNVTRDQARIRHAMILVSGDRKYQLTQAEWAFRMDKTFRKEMAWTSDALAKASGVGRAPFVAPLIYAWRADPEFFTKMGAFWLTGMDPPNRSFANFRDDALSGKTLPKYGGRMVSGSVTAMFRMLTFLAAAHQKSQPPRYTATMNGLRYWSERLRDGAWSRWEHQVLGEED